MESKVTTREKIISCFKDGQTIAIGGQTGHWMPERLIDCILESGARHLTVYSTPNKKRPITLLNIKSLEVQICNMQSKKRVADSMQLSIKRQRSSVTKHYNYKIPSSFIYLLQG